MKLYFTTTIRSTIRPALLPVLLVISCNLLAQQPLPEIYDPAAKINYVRTWVMKAPETTEQGVVTRPVSDVVQSTQYIDGLGRPVQTVLKQGAWETNGVAADLVSLVVYDQYGRETSQYLPFKANSTGGNPFISTGMFKSNPFQQQASFMTAQFGSQGETYFYGRTNTETSPLNRVKKAMAPGNNWVGSDRGISKDYSFNAVGETALRMWNISEVPGSLPVDGGVYPGSQLYRNATFDEHNNLSYEYIDKTGQLVVRSMQNGSEWLITFYVYDKLGNLRCVIPPQAVAAISSNWVMTQGVMDELCFRYEYDQRNRMIVKKVPGAGETRMVYDARDRMVMMQDANMRTPAQQKWMYTTYDALDRPVSTGLITDPNYTNHSLHLAAAYTSIAYPNLGSYTYEILTRTFYDDYSWVAPSGSGLSTTLITTYTSNPTYFYTPGNSFPYPQSITQTAAIKGMVTGTITNIVATGNNLCSVNIYDDHGRLIQTQGGNLTWTNDIVTMQYSFSGQLLRTLVCHAKAGTNAQAYKILTKNEYDDAGRLTRISKKVENSPETVIVENEYDALGQLKKKKLAPAYNNNAGLETENFDYNIRGWLLGMNRDYAKDASNTNYFGFDLGYDKANNNIIGGQTYSNPQYNGNIEGMVWKSKGNGEKRKYDFSYDAVNRLTKASFTQYTSGTFNLNANVNFSVGGDPLTGDKIKYDLNGNILEMWQKGLKITGSDWIDKLAYNYYDNSNKLKNVIDANNDPGTKLGDFRTSLLHPNQVKTGSTVDYTYDVNGNLKKDLNKDIGTASAEDIVYNYLNLPQAITVRKSGGVKGTIYYTYDATGKKLKKEVAEDGQPLKTTLYIGGVVYENDVLQFIGMEEGRIRLRSSDNTYLYDYMLKDHLSNVRAVLTDETAPATIYQATIEDATRAAEIALFTQITQTESLKPDPGFDSDGNNLKVSKLFNASGNDKRTGPGVVLKVMAGDKFKALTYGWYSPTGTNAATLPGATDILSNILSAFTGGIPAGASHGGGQVSGSGVLNTPVTDFLNYQNDPAQYNNTRPKAFLNWIVLDEEQFKIVDGNYGAVQVPAITTGMTKQVMQAASGANIEIKKNGYLYVYVSNESQGSVYFDDIRVEHTRGPLLEETHYYPFGLTMAGISSKALNTGGNDPSCGCPNKKGFNGNEIQNKEFTDGSGLEVYDFNARTYDQQIGRFIQIDPLTDEGDQEKLSTYHFSNNNPIRYNDPDGKCPGCWRAMMIAKAKAAQEAQKKHENSYNAFSPLIYQGFANVEANNVRSQYVEDAAKLSATDKQGRIDLKERARANTPEPFKSMIETGRPMEGERAKVNDPTFKGNATKTNIEVNETARTTGTLGGVFLAVGVVQSTWTIATSNDPLKETITEGAGWGGAFLVGSQFATAAAPLGPVASFAAGAVGSTLGFIAGKKAGDAVMTALPKALKETIERCNCDPTMGLQ
jgi:RHS repeat-associated protein